MRARVCVCHFIRYFTKEHLEKQHSLSMCLYLMRNLCKFYVEVSKRGLIIRLYDGDWVIQGVARFRGHQEENIGECKSRGKHVYTRRSDTVNEFADATRMSAPSNTTARCAT